MPVRPPTVLGLALMTVLGGATAARALVYLPPDFVTALSVAPAPGGYQYAYSLSLLPTAPTQITFLNMSGVEGYVAGSVAASGAGFDLTAPTVSGGGTQTGLLFNSPTGLTLIDGPAVFSFVSSLPPVGAVTLTGNAGFDTFTSGTFVGPGPTSSPGGSQDTGLPPISVGTGTDGSPLYTFSGILSGEWTDPLGSDFQFSVLPNSPDFLGVTLPTGLGDFLLTTPGGPTLSETAGASVSFGPNGVAQFDLFGAAAAGPLPVQEFFVGGGTGGFTQRVLPAAGTVPEPSSFALLALGLLPLGFLARKRRRSA